MLYFIDQFTSVLLWITCPFDSAVKKHYVFSDKLGVIEEESESSEDDEDEIIMPILIPDIG